MIMQWAFKPSKAPAGPTRYKFYILSSGLRANATAGWSLMIGSGSMLQHYTAQLSIKPLNRWGYHKLGQARALWSPQCQGCWPNTQEQIMKRVSSPTAAAAMAVPLGYIIVTQPG